MRIHGKAREGWGCMQYFHRIPTAPPPPPPKLTAEDHSPSNKVFPSVFPRPILSQSGEKGERPGSSRFFIWNTRLPPHPQPHTEPFDFSNTSANACIPRYAISLGPKLLVSVQLSFFFFFSFLGGVVFFSSLFSWGGSIF